MGYEVSGVVTKGRSVFVDRNLSYRPRSQASAPAFVACSTRFFLHGAKKKAAEWSLGTRLLSYLVAHFFLILPLSISYLVGSAVRVFSVGDEVAGMLIYIP